MKLIAFCLLLHVSFISRAEIFTATDKGNYSQQEIWAPRYPGNIIKETDTIVIHGEIKLNVDLVVRGTFIVRENASLTGSSNFIIVKSGTLFNLGTSAFGTLTNRGAIYNKQKIEVSSDFVNSGNVLNYESIKVGNLLDNTGIITGKDGMVSADRKFVNSRSGIVKGYIDVCSNNFMNVDGGIVDTEKTTFCGNPILSQNGIFSKKSDPLHFEKSVSEKSLRTGQYTEF